MIDIFKMQDSFYLKWADKLINNQISSWKSIPISILKPVGGLSVFKCSVSDRAFKGINLIDSYFWKNVLIRWLKYKNQEPASHDFDLSDPMFNNSKIRFK